MKFAIIGGTGAMGSILGGRLAQTGHNVTLIDVHEPSIAQINTNGLQITDKDGNTDTIQVEATSQPERIGIVDVAIVFVKCFHTEAAVKKALPCIGPNTTVLSLQNGWGNGPLISELLGPERVRLGVTYISGTSLGIGQVKQAGNPIAFIGNPNGAPDPTLNELATAFNAFGLQTTVSDNIVRDIYSKLALNVCTLPTSGILQFQAHMLVEHDSMEKLMAALLHEMVAVAKAQGVPLDFDERWTAITTVLKNAVGGKSSMYQDIEARRQTEIDVINGAIVSMGKKLGIATPYNDAMVWMVKSLQATF
jgi:2-dehydropantoate 2-reductase